MMVPVATRPAPLFPQHSSPIFAPRTAPVHHPSLPPLHTQSSSTIPIIPSGPSNYSHPSPISTPSSASASSPTHSKSRPKLCAGKKSSCSTKQQSKVQLSLEAKVERCKGFHSFFVPLARSVPPPPPSSPILGPTAVTAGGGALGDVPMADYFGSWQSPKKGAIEEQWIEDVAVGVDVPGGGRPAESQRMDVDG